MSQKMKRMLALLLCLMMTASLLVVNAASGDGTDASRVSTPSDLDPDPTATATPTNTPSQTPTNTPTPTPTATPVEELKLKPSDSNAEQSGSTWQLTVEDTATVNLGLKWNAVTGASVYEVRVWLTSDKDDFNGSTSGTSITAKDLVPGNTYHVQVRALDSNGSALKTESIAVALIVEEATPTSTPGSSEEPTPTATPDSSEEPAPSATPDSSEEPSHPDFPSGGGRGGMRGGSAGGSGSSGITPGKQLTGDHDSGTMNMDAYTGVILENVNEDVMVQLDFQGTMLDAALADGNAFTAEYGDAVLTLTPVSTDEQADWQITLTALNTLRDSGLDTLELTSGETVVTMATDLPFSGRVYTGLRAEGYTGKDFVLQIGAEGIRVTVDGKTYDYHDGVLTEAEE